MENGQMPPVQPVNGQYGAPQGMPVGAGGMPPGRAPSGGRPMVQQAPTIPVKRRDTVGIVKSVVIGVLVLLVAVFAGLYAWQYVQVDELQQDIDAQIADAVAKAVDKQRTEDEEAYQEWSKNPYERFSGPVNYGEVSFLYPKTWNVYEEADAVAGGEFRSYFNPVKVNTVADSTLNALRFIISTDPYDKVVANYQKEVEKRGSTLRMEACEVGNGGSRITASCYEGTIPGTELQGRIVVFGVRDKTVILQTDSVDVFGNDFQTLLDTVTFNA